jgi:2-succinyl-6-hydroxy-2,4-cyclohexadiene-1-carboxylate synthase
MDKTSWQDGYYKNEWGKLYYLDSGRQNAETIVFLHGFTGSSHDFFSLPDSIIDSYRCLIPDLPGHGKTQILKNRKGFKTDGQIALLNRWLQSLKQTKYHLWGYSMGGRLALQIALKNPYCLHSLILISTTAGIREEKLRQKRRETDKQLAQKILNSEALDFLKSWLSQPLFQGIVERGEDFIMQEVLRRLPLQPLGLACSLQYFGTGVMPSVWHQLSDLRVSTLAIAGSKDRKYLELAFELVSLMPNATLKIFETSHAPQLENPDLFWQEIAHFLQQK